MLWLIMEKARSSETMLIIVVSSFSKLSITDIFISKNRTIAVLVFIRKFITIYNLNNKKVSVNIKFNDHIVSIKKVNY